jgi:HK97 gp10 family phage protein
VIALNWLTVNGQIGGMVQRFAELPRHIAKKHMRAAVRRAIKEGVPVLRKLTPKGLPRNTRAAVKRDAGGRFLQGSGKKMRIRGGALRRSVTTKAKYIGRNRDGVVYGVVGYRAGTESRKAIWLEFGTSRIKPREIMQKFRQQYGGPAAKTLAREMRKALAAAARELASGKNSNPNYRRK